MDASSSDSAPGLPSPLSDVAGNDNADRLRKLSQEVSRIASALARLSDSSFLPPPALPRAAAESPRTNDSPPLLAETVRSVVRARRLRARYLPDELFADPAWDMMLDLLHAELTELRVPVSSLCIAAAVPATTALRWLKILVNQGLLVRHADPYDARRIFVELAPRTSDALRRYFAEISSVTV